MGGFGRPNAKPSRTTLDQRVAYISLIGGQFSNFGAFCLDARTLTFCQLMGFPLKQEQLNF